MVHYCYEELFYNCSGFFLLDVCGLHVCARKREGGGTR